MNKILVFAFAFLLTSMTLHATNGLNSDFLSHIKKRWIRQESSPEELEAFKEMVKKFKFESWPSNNKNIEKKNMGASIKLIASNHFAVKEEIHFEANDSAVSYYFNTDNYKVLMRTEFFPSQIEAQTHFFEAGFHKYRDFEPMSEPFDWKGTVVAQNVWKNADGPQTTSNYFTMAIHNVYLEIRVAPLSNAAIDENGILRIFPNVKSQENSLIRNLRDLFLLEK